MRVTVLLATVLAVTVVSCADANRAYVRKAVRIMDKEGLFAEGPAWDSTRTAALHCSPASLDDAQDIVRSALLVAGGKHSFLKAADRVAEDAASDSWPSPEVTIGEDGIAQIILPRFSGNPTEGVKYADTVLQALPDSLSGAVIDLRDNTGGDMYPMISAIHRFLPDGNVLRFRSRKRTQWIPLSYVVKCTGLPRYARIDCPVALLTNEWTASSGEAVLLCFRGLDSVRVFGGPTAGYASANRPFPMPDGSSLVLTTGCDVARTGEVFCDDPIDPDELTGTPLEDALAWLRSFRPGN